jgi:Spy/CpxP family protein refolding chaperone
MISDYRMREMVMRKLSQWIVGLGAAAWILTITVFPSYADEGHGKMGHGRHDEDKQNDHSGHYLKHLLKLAKEIGLTQEQVGKIKTLQLDFKRTEARLEADTKIAKLELHALLDDEQADLNAIQAKVDQVKKAEAACLFAAIKSKRTAMAMLTPDQREKERAQHERMKGGGQHGSGMGGMNHGGMMGGMGGGGGQAEHDGGDHGSGNSGGGQQQQH